MPPLNRRRPASTQEARARWLWQHRPRWGGLPERDVVAARALFKEMQAIGLYSKKTAALDGIKSVMRNCDLARELHRTGLLDDVPTPA